MYLYKYLALCVQELNLLFFFLPGECSYSLTTDNCPVNGTDNPDSIFDVVVENIACNAEGFSCTKSVQFKYKNEVCVAATAKTIICTG